MLAGKTNVSSSVTADLTVGLSDAAIEALIQQRQEGTAVEKLGRERSYPQRTSGKRHYAN
jgi:hypothetical protein